MGAQPGVGRYSIVGSIWNVAAVSALGDKGKLRFTGVDDIFRWRFLDIPEKFFPFGGFDEILKKIERALIEIGSGSAEPGHYIDSAAAAPDEDGVILTGVFR